jgi:hypothetical protein
VTPKLGDPVQLDPALLGEVPAYARVRQFERARQTVALSEMAARLLPAEEARAYAEALLRLIPALDAARAAGHRAPAVPEPVTSSRASAGAR